MTGGAVIGGAPWWDQLAVAALLGTDRRPQLDTGSLPGPLNSAAAGLSGDPAAVLLDLSALAVAYRRGGEQPVEVTAIPDRAPAEPRRGVSPRAGALLAELHSRPVMVRYWCETAAAAGLVAPDAQLPALLDRAVSQPALRPAIGSVLGERGRWLAGQQPHWAAVVIAPAAVAAPAGDGTAPGERWQFGNSKQRTAWLRATRRIDPASALAALAGTWSKESGPDRASFLEVLAEGLGPADEPFLDAALDDPQPAVRAAAAELLTRLPDSAYGRRMAARVRAFVRRERVPGAERAPGAEQTRVMVEVPDELDPAAVRDGVTSSPPAGPSGRSGKQWWLEQVVAAAPLEVWAPLLGLEPARAVLTEFGEFAQPAIRAGWVRAAIRQRNREWAFAVLSTGTLLRVERLLPLLDADQLTVVLGQRLPTLTPAQLPLLVGYLSGCPGPWPEPVLAAVLDWLLGVLGAISPLSAPVKPVMELIALRSGLGTAVRQVAGTAATLEDGLWRHLLIGVAHDLSDRIRIHEELQ